MCIYINNTCAQCIPPPHIYAHCLLELGERMRILYMHCLHLPPPSYILIYVSIVSQGWGLGRENAHIRELLLEIRVGSREGNAHIICALSPPNPTLIAGRDNAHIIRSLSFPTPPHIWALSPPTPILYMKIGLGECNVLIIMCISPPLYIMRVEMGEDNAHIVICVLPPLKSLPHI